MRPPCLRGEWVLSSVVFSVTVFAILGTAGCGDDDESLPPESPSVYRFANGCFSVQQVPQPGSVRFLARTASGGGYAFSAAQQASATPFFLKPSALGTYLLYDEATVDDGYQQKVQRIRDNGGFPVLGFGFDLNGFAGAPGPRFGPKSHCGVPQTDRLTYPFKSYAGDVTFHEPKVGNRTLDFNTEGLVHIGLLPELIQDVRRDGADLEPLFKSAEGYIRMWEKSERHGAELRNSGEM